MKRIYYKDYKGDWIKSDLKPTQKNLKFVQKHYALNGKATIQVTIQEKN